MITNVPTAPEIDKLKGDLLSKLGTAVLGNDYGLKYNRLRIADKPSSVVFFYRMSYTFSRTISVHCW